MTSLTTCHTAAVTMLLLPLPVCHQAAFPVYCGEHFMLPDFIIFISQHDPEGCSSCLLLQTAMTDFVMLIRAPVFPKANSL